MQKKGIISQKTQRNSKSFLLIYLLKITVAHSNSPDLSFLQLPTSVVSLFTFFHSFIFDFIFSFYTSFSSRKQYQSFSCKRINCLSNSIFLVITCILTQPILLCNMGGGWQTYFSSQYIYYTNNIFHCHCFQTLHMTIKQI